MTIGLSVRTYAKSKKKKKEKDALKSIMVDHECVKKLTINTEQFSIII